MKKRVCIIGVNYSYHVLLQSLRHFNNFEVVGIAGKKKKKSYFREHLLLHILEKNDQSVEPKFSSYRCSSYGAREDFWNFY